jgi:hypothetical protein
MINLRSQTIRLAHSRPELRAFLLPILAKTAKEFATQDALREYLKEHPDADKSNHSVKKTEESGKKTEDKAPGKSKKRTEAIKEELMAEGGVTGRTLNDEDLSGADLKGAFISQSFLNGAKLSKADLSHSNLKETQLAKADLSGANLVDANLQKVDLSHADLSGADLTDADLTGATLYRVKFDDKTKWPKGYTPEDWDKIEAESESAHKEWVKKHPDGKRTVSEFVTDAWHKIMGKGKGKKAGNLRSATIRLAYQNPELRPYLLPLLAQREE